MGSAFFLPISVSIFILRKKLNPVTPQTNTEIGKSGENLAKEFLIQQGYTFLASNWRYSRAEVDLIFLHETLIVFVEVKTRSSDYFGRPEAFVDKKKQKLLASAAAVYCERNNHVGEIRFDVISIVQNRDDTFKIDHLKDAFFPGLEWK
jgi:putative endonuclease